MSARVAEKFDTVRKTGHHWLPTRAGSRDRRISGT